MRDRLALFVVALVMLLSGASAWAQFEAWPNVEFAGPSGSDYTAPTSGVLVYTYVDGGQVYMGVSGYEVYEGSVYSCWIAPSGQYCGVLSYGVGGGTGTPEPPALNPFNLSHEDGALVFGAVAALWLMGWAWRAVYAVLDTRGED